MAPPITYRDCRDCGAPISSDEIHACSQGVTRRALLELVSALSRANPERPDGCRAQVGIIADTLIPELERFDTFPTKPPTRVLELRGHVLVVPPFAPETGRPTLLDAVRERSAPGEGWKLSEIVVKHQEGATWAQLEELMAKARAAKDGVA